MLDSNYIQIFSGSFIIVKMAVERLHEVGIEAIVKDESESGRLAGFGASIQNFQELYVNKAELNKAIPIINQVKAETEAK